MAIRFEILQQRIAAEQVDSKEIVPLLPLTVETSPTREANPAAAEPLPFIGPKFVRQPTYAIITDSLGRDDSIYLSLKRHRISELQIAQLNQAVKKVFNSRTASQPSDYYTLAVDTSGVIQRFEYVPRRQPERPLLIERLDGELVGRRLDLPLATRVEAIEVRIVDNLANAISAAGEGDALTDVLADDIFGSVLDFRLDPRRGDHLDILFEKLYKEDEFIRYGRVLLASYAGQKVSQLGIYFEDREGNRGYYDDEGKSLERMFLRLPLPYRRITSPFNRRRFHPVLKKTIPHLGTDYGAVTGTEVRATARGRIVHAGRKGTLGKAVIIDHPNGYRTRYGHLSKILVKKGQNVKQKDVVGQVGATGRTTGPHLHYELIKDSRHVNPENVNKGTKGKPLKKKYLQVFNARRDSLLTILKTALHSRESVIAAKAATEAGSVE